MKKEKPTPQKAVSRLNFILCIFVFMVVFSLVHKCAESRKPKPLGYMDNITEVMDQELDKLVKEEYGKQAKVILKDGYTLMEVGTKEAAELQQKKNILELAMDNGMFDEMTVINKEKEIENLENKLSRRKREYAYYRRVVIGLPDGNRISAFQKTMKETRESTLFFRHVLTGEQIDTTFILEQLSK